MKAGEAQFTTLQTPYSGSFFGVCGGDGLVLAYGLRGTVYASVDGGDSWTLVETGIGTALTGCTAIDGGYLISAASGQLIQLELDAGAVTSRERSRAPWPLTGLGALDGRPVGVGLGGIWLEQDQAQ
jgi:photosystem II stability/assembly factor-like uncharacterized protein